MKGNVCLKFNGSPLSPYILSKDGVICLERFSNFEAI
jgi:hypothetical protein